INLRGTVVPVLDLRARLGLPAKPIEPADYLIVLGGDPQLLAVRIDRALELATLAVTTLNRRGGDEPAAGVLGAVAQQADQLIPLLDPRVLVPPAQVTALRELAAPTTPH